MQTCVGCGTKAPETETNYTLISAKFGWRLSRTKLRDGTVVLEWRCPACWREHKRVRAQSSPPLSPPRIGAPPPIVNTLPVPAKPPSSTKRTPLPPATTPPSPRRRPR